ncbi:MAG: hypothetical protein ACLPKI_25820 [Streptosporangiaceae bacterium]
MSSQQLVAIGAELGGSTHRPLSASTGITRHAVHEVLDAAELLIRYKAIARLSGHLAAMWRTVYPHAAGQPGPGGQLRAACLARARELEWVMRGLECHLAGEMYAAGRPAMAVPAALARHLDSYWPAEQALVTWIEDGLGPDGCGQLAHAYWRALGHAPTRPHPRCPRSGPLRQAAFWWHGRWDRLLDGVDSRAGVGRDFALILAQPPGGQPASRAGDSTLDARGGQPASRAGDGTGAAPAGLG